MIWQRLAEYALVKIIDYLVERYLKHGEEEKAESLKVAKNGVRYAASNGQNERIA